MTRLTWANSNRTFETGLDRGVLYPKGGSGIPWSGLTAVDEGGADAAKAYYVDGRPFLYLPTPKEFSATLKAYTYPDEFSALMGLVEATDGMYLDSQQGDVFDLSYRTLLGNAHDGVDYGYKIHLIYNATVAPQGNSYATMGDGVNPSEFAWQIQAVPTPVLGFRATAHIIIDTRHMDKSRVDQIEAMLYGTPVAEGMMPAPGVILNLLSFGNSIIITDLGDGRWTAEGSYDNVYLIGDGEFQIDNVTATNNPDGTFSISTTNA